MDDTHWIVNNTSGLVTHGYRITKLRDSCTECAGGGQGCSDQSVGFYVTTCTNVMSDAIIMATAIFASISIVYIPCNNIMIPVKLFVTTPQCQSFILQMMMMITTIIKCMLTAKVVRISMILTSHQYVLPVHVRSPLTSMHYTKAFEWITSSGYKGWSKAMLGTYKFFAK